MPKISLGGGFGEYHGGGSFEWNAPLQESTNPVIDIRGTGHGWAKETYGPVKVTGTGTRTAVRITGAGGWKIHDEEQISG